MIKRLIVCTILMSMTLHCATRLGFLDQLYQKRNEIAYALGLIREIPIAMCNSDYDFDTGLKIETHDSSHSLPSSLIQAREINLFFVVEYCFAHPERVPLYSKSLVSPVDLYGLTLVTSIFHPPSA